MVEYRELESLVAATAAEPKTYCWMHGYFTAVVCAPRPVMASGWMDAVLGDEDRREPFGTVEQAQRMLELMSALNNEVAHDLNVETFRPPIRNLGRNTVDMDDAGEWCRGFVAGAAGYMLELVHELPDDGEQYAFVDAFMRTVLTVGLPEQSLKEGKCLTPELTVQLLGALPGDVPELRRLIAAMVVEKPDAFVHVGMEDDDENDPPVDSFEQALEELECADEYVPFNAIRFLHGHPSTAELRLQMVEFIDNAYDYEFFGRQQCTPLAPLWFLVVAEQHICPELVEPVIRLFTLTEDTDDFISEQGSVLVYRLCKTYPETVPERCLQEIEKQVDAASGSPYLYLFDALAFLKPIDAYKDRLLALLSRSEEVFQWREPFIMHLADIGLKEALPVIRELCRKELDSGTLNQYRYAKDALEHPERNEPDAPFAETRSDWEKYYRTHESFITACDEDEPFVPPEPVRSDKIGRNAPCPCGSGKKYKKCCGKG